MIDHLSHSSMGLYQLCGKRWQFKYIHGLAESTTDALDTGKAFHAAVAAYLTRKWEFGEAEEGAMTAAREAFDASAITASSEKFDLWRAAIDRDDVTEMLAGLTPAEDSSGAIVERRVQYQIDGMTVPIMGFIDMIARDGAIVDFKTSSKAWTTQQHDETVQLHFYHAAAASMGLPVGDLLRHVIIHPKGIQTFECHFQPEKYAFLEHVARDVDHGVSFGFFPRNPKSCFAWGQRCPFWSECRGGE